MKINVGICSLFLLLLVVSSCSSRKMTYFQTKEKRKGEIVDLSSYRIENTIRFQPDDILGITVNVPEEPKVAAAFNLPLIPTATNENSSGSVDGGGVGRQTYLIGKDGTIDFPVLGTIKIAGYTQAELEKYLKELLSEKLIATPVVTVRLLNFKINFIGEVGRQGEISVNQDHISLLEALSLAGDILVTGKRDDIRIFRRNPDGGYREISVDMSKEDIISSPYYFLHQNDIVYVQPTRVKTQSADISPRYSFILGVASLALTVYLFAKSL